MLEQAIDRLKQVAEAFAPGFVALAKGVKVDFVTPDRPGLVAVGHILSRVLIAEVMLQAITNVLVGNKIIGEAEMSAMLAKAAGAAANKYAEALNTGTLGLTGGFGFDLSKG